MLKQCWQISEGRKRLNRFFIYLTIAEITFCNYCYNIRKAEDLARKMMDHSTLFRQLLEESGITQKHLSTISKFHQSKINRFLRHVADLSAGDLFELLSVMPSDFQKSFWERQLGTGYNTRPISVLKPSLDESGHASESFDLLPLIENLPPLEQIRIMKAIASSDIFEQQNQELSYSA